MTGVRFAPSRHPDDGPLIYLGDTFLVALPTQDERDEDESVDAMAREIEDAILAAVAECDWKEDGDGTWWTACGEGFQFNGDGPAENGFKACPYCGHELSSHPFSYDDAD